MRIRVECPRCRAKTRWHDTHGGDMAEWNARFSRGEGQSTPTERRAARPVATPGVTPLG